MNSHSTRMQKAALKPRKQPAQDRSTATVEALHTAAIQVLTREGLRRCTTTRIAERAGASVGTLYQYYPNRDALLAAVLARHLEHVAEVVEQACATHRQRPVAEMARGLVVAFLAEKLRNPGESRALYAVAAERGGPALVMRMHARMTAAIAAMLSSATDARFDDATVVASITLNALTGPVRNVLEGRAPRGFETELETQLVLLATAYLQAHRPKRRAATKR